MTERILNAPNIISVGRLLLSFVLFVLISVTDWWITAAVLFVVAVATDVVDGHLARKYNLITTFGRIIDPLVDKVIVCGSFIFMQNVPESGIDPWMTTVIIIRELYITSLRGFFEEQGIDFSAQWAGKLKMFLQSVAVPFSMVGLSPLFSDSETFLLCRDLALWAAVLVTIYSGIEYTLRGTKMYAERKAEKRLREADT